MLQKLSRISLVLLAAAFCVSTALSAPATRAGRRERARTLYGRAVEKRAQFNKIPPETRTKRKFLTLLRSFDLVRRTDPTFGNVPPSLRAMAELYREMGDTFGEEKYYRLAVKSFKFLIREYPYSVNARRAWYGIGEIQSADLEDIAAARKAYEMFLKRNPHAREAGEVKQKLQELKLLASRKPEGVPPPAPRKDGKTSGPAVQVTEVRHWAGPNYTRVVVGTGGEVKYRVARLQKPDRIYFDILHSYPADSIKGKDLDIENGFLKKIRIAQHRPNVTRVVLDVDEIEDYTIFPLPNPYRIVVDIRGKGAQSTKLQAKNEPLKPGTRRSGTPKREGEGTKAATRVATGGHGESGENGSAGKPKESPGKGAAGNRENVKTASAKPALPTAGGNRTLTRALGLKIGRIVIDPGHGGHDPGTIGPTGLSESKLVLDVAQRLKKLIESSLESEVMLTRDGDRFVPLEERTAIANKQAADLFISIHANASRQRWVRGVETFYLSFTRSKTSLEVAARENASSQESVNRLQDMIKKIALNEMAEESEEFARVIQSSMYNRLRKVSWQKNRGVKKAPFVVLIGADMPAVLAEISFITNPKDETLLKKGEHRQRIAEALYGGVARYVESLGGATIARQGANDASSSSGISSY